MSGFKNPEDRKGPRREAARNVNRLPGSPLTEFEQLFLEHYLELAHPTLAYRESISEEESSTLTDTACRLRAYKILKRPHVQAELTRIKDEIRKDTIASATEILEYFTAVMRGQEKDQFGLEPTLADRTNAAKELAKRTIDYVKYDKSNKPAATIEVKLDWGRS